jgi:hypothetical protein
MLQGWLMKFRTKRNGHIFGIFVLHRKPNISYGELVKGAYQLGCVYKRSGFLVHNYVFFATKKMRMIDMCFFIAKLVYKRGKVHVWNIYFCLGYSSKVTPKMLFF